MIQQPYYLAPLHISRWMRSCFSFCQILRSPPGMLPYSTSVFQVLPLEHSRIGEYAAAAKARTRLLLAEFCFRVACQPPPTTCSEPNTRHHIPNHTFFCPICREVLGALGQPKPSGIFRTNWPTNEQMKSTGVVQLGVSIETEVLRASRHEVMPCIFWHTALSQASRLTSTRVFLVVADETPKTEALKSIQSVAPMYLFACHSQQEEDPFHGQDSFHFCLDRASTANCCSTTYLFPQDVVENLQLGAGGVQDRKQFALKIANDLFQFMSSFSQATQAGPEVMVVPTNVLDR